jgi:hypothetical protein
VVSSCQCLSYRFGGRRKKSQERMLFGKIVHAACQAADRALLGEAVQCQIDGLAAPKVQKVGRHDHGTSSGSTDAVKYLLVNALRSS